ncbi:MAG: 2-hydroxyacyl-CoA dehydratase subunit D [Candidatus Jordarchaeum sp.]|uniref:2-hydroxyacyl-CoA dehydratase subunit D n=1 Tax=Candidatus Jordarchaeum sp. TaxID=2823881 RepID=UPI004049D4CD
MLENGKEHAKLMSLTFSIAGKFIDSVDLTQALATLTPEEQAVLGTLQIALAEVIPKPKLKDIAREWIKCNYIYWKDTVLGGLEEGKKVVYFYFTHSPEIYFAMDLIPICAEYQPALASAVWANGAEEGIDRIEAEGLPSHLCSTQKGTMGWLLMNKVPKPDVIVKPVGICDPSNMAYQWMADKTGAEFIPIDTPYSLSAEAFEYYLKEFKNMVAKLEEVTGQKLDPERLREVVECGNKAYEYFLENLELRKAVPCPDPSLSHLLSAGTMLTSVGRPEAIDYFKMCRDVAKRNVEKGVGVLPEGVQEIRTLWTNVPILFDFPFYDWIEEDLGAVHLFDCLDWFFTEPIDTSSTESMIRGLAERSFNWPMHRQSMAYADDWIDDFVWLAKEYKADCCIFGGHMACKHSWGLNKLLSDTLKKEVGIPSLRFDMDLADKRFTSIADIKAKMTEFIKTVRETKKD